MATYGSKRKKRWQSSPAEKRKRFPSNEENSPCKRTRTRTVDSPLKPRDDNPLVNSDDDSPTFKAKSFYGSKRKAALPVIDKYPLLVLERCSVPNSTSLAKSPESHSSISSGFTRPSNRSCATKHKKGTPEIENKEVKSEKRKLKETCYFNKRKHIVESSYKRLPHVITPMKSADKLPTEEDVLVTKNPKGSLTPAVPDNRKKFFKNRSPASASITVVRKGFNLKFMPHRLSTKFSKEFAKKDRNNNKRSAKNKHNSSNSVAKKGKIGNSTDSTSSVDLNVADLQPLDQIVTETTELHDIVTEITELDSTDCKSNGESSHDTLADHSPTSSISLLSEIQPNVSDSIQSCTGSQDLFTSDDRSEVPDVCAATSSSASSKKMFPIFDVNSRVSSPGSASMSLRRSTRSSPRLQMVLREKAGMEQMILDAGQKKFGATQCAVCGMVYTHADPTDETTHNKFHQSVISTLSFPGWKKERVVQEFPIEGSRVIMVLHDDPKYATKKVEDINRIMGQELGFPEQTSAFRPTFKAFLYISDEKTVEGCCIAEPITEGYRVIADTEANTQQGGQRPWCCETDPESAVVGISRLWVYGPSRNKGIATKLVDCVRQCFEYGVLIEKEKTAFSDPTPDGKIFATKYFGTESFLVYKYRPVKY